MADWPRLRDAAAGVPSGRHWLGFLVSGIFAFAVDAGTMELAIRWLGMPVLLARLAGVCVAMVAAWLAHRTFTFALSQRPTFGEFARYVASASTTAAINYSVFAILLHLVPGIGRIPALVLASCVATIFSYLSMRYAVFRRH